MGPIASLNTVWFALIGVLWTGYFVLEGFDFGVAVLMPFVSRDDTDRRLCINAIGPVWDGNEVWLLVAGGATFAAFPTWYATMFSGFYLALFLILAGLIVRGVSFEFRAHDPSSHWRASWDKTLFWGSLVPAVLWGVAFTNLVRGLRIVAGPRYHGGLLGLIHPVALLGGLASLALFSLHGATFLALKTTGELHQRARRAAGLLVGPAAILPAGLIVWVALDAPGESGSLPVGWPLGLGAAAVVLVLAGGWWWARHREGVAFACSAGAIMAMSAAAFTALFPKVMTSTVPGRSLTIWNAASEHRTLVVMTIVAAIFTPFVLGYQAWSYWVFRQRLVRPPQAPEPAGASSDVAGRADGGGLEGAGGDHPGAVEA